MNINEYYGKVLLVYEHEKGRLINEHHCVYFMQEAHVTNPYALELSMLDEGYFRPATLEERLKALTIPDLKKILEKNKLSKTGNKPALIERLLPHCDYLMDTDLKNTIYFLSNKGQQFFDDNKDLIDYHKNHKYSPLLEEYFALREDYHRNYHGICLRYYEGLLKENNIRHDFVGALAFHSNMLGMHEQALYYYLLKIYSCLNLLDCPWMFGKDNLLLRKSYREDYDFSNDYKIHTLIFDDDIVEIIKLKDYYYDGTIPKIYSDYPAEYQLITPELFFYLVDDIFTKPYVDKNKYINYACDIYLEVVDKILNDGTETPMQRIAKFLGRR